MRRRIRSSCQTNGRCMAGSTRSSRSTISNNALIVIDFKEIPKCETALNDTRSARGSGVPSPPPRLLALIETDLRLKPGDGKAGMGFVR